MALPVFGIRRGAGSLEPLGDPHLDQRLPGDAERGGAGVEALHHPLGKVDVDAAGGALDRFADQALVRDAAFGGAGLDAVDQRLRGAVLTRAVLGSACQATGSKAVTSRSERSCKRKASSSSSVAIVETEPKAGTPCCVHRLGVILASTMDSRRRKRRRPQVLRSAPTTCATSGCGQNHRFHRPYSLD